MRGSQTARVDEKGRLKVPADHKRAMEADGVGKTFYITSRDGTRAEIYPLEVWEGIEREMAKLPPTPEKRRFLDAMNYYGQTVEMDAQERLLIPQKLREKAALVGEVAVLGMGRRMEVVNDAQFVARMEAAPFREEDVTAIPIADIL